MPSAARTEASLPSSLATLLHLLLLPSLRVCPDFNKGRAVRKRQVCTTMTRNERSYFIHSLFCSSIIACSLATSSPSSSCSFGSSFMADMSSSPPKPAETAGAAFAAVAAILQRTGSESAESCALHQ